MALNSPYPYQGGFYGGYKDPDNNKPATFMGPVSDAALKSAASQALAQVPPETLSAQAGMSSGPLLQKTAGGYPNIGLSTPPPPSAAANSGAEEKMTQNIPFDNGAPVQIPGKPAANPVQEKPALAPNTPLAVPPGGKTPLVDPNKVQAQSVAQQSSPAAGQQQARNPLSANPSVINGVRQSDGVRIIGGVEVMNGNPLDNLATSRTVTETTAARNNNGTSIPGQFNTEKRTFGNPEPVNPLAAQLTRTEIAGKQQEIDQKANVNAMIEKYSDPKTSAEERQAIGAKLQLMGVGGKNQREVANAVDYDDQGNRIQTPYVVDWSNPEQSRRVGKPMLKVADFEASMDATQMKKYRSLPAEQQNSIFAAWKKSLGQ